MPHLLEASDLNPELLDQIFDKAAYYESVINQPPGDPERRAVASEYAGSVVTLLFLSDSTRTMESFDTAAKYLGAATKKIQGKFVTSEDGTERLHIAGSATAKGESYTDTLRMLDGYSDAIVLRSPKEGAAKEAAAICTRSVVANGGDGSGQHPTQAVLDLYTIRKELGRLDNLKLLFGNDLHYSRVAHSLIEVLSQYENNEFVFASSRGLRIPDDTRHHLLETESKFTEVENPYPHLADMDVVHWQRSQKERWAEPALACDTLQLDVRKMNELPDGAVAMHALPMTDEEVGPLVAEHPKFIAYEQARNGVPVRMALLAYMFSRADVRLEPTTALMEAQVA